MATEPRSDRNTAADDPVVWLAIAGGVYCIVWATWHFLHTQIATGYGYLRYAEFYLLHVLGELMDVPGLSSVHDWIAELCAPQGALSGCFRDFSTVTWTEISSSTVYVNIAIVVLIVAYAARLFVRANATHPRLLFARSHNVKSFVKELSKARNPKTGHLLYPHLRMFSALNLIDAPLDDPKFGMSWTSRQFLVKHGLALDWRQEGRDTWIPSVDRVKAATVFREQLGQCWTSSANLSPGETLLAAIAMPRVAATDAALDDAQFKSALADSDKVIRFCWECFVPPTAKPKKGEKPPADPNAWLQPQIDLTLARNIIKQYIGSKPVQLIIERHAFNRTILMALFLQARRLGVLQPAEMRWLRFYDRPLWYVLQTIGRQATYAEGAGPLSHFLYESKAGASLVEPQIDKAVTSLEAALAIFKFSDADKARYEALHPKPGAEPKAGAAPTPESPVK